MEVLYFQLAKECQSVFSVSLLTASKIHMPWNPTHNTCSATVGDMSVILNNILYQF